MSLWQVYAGCSCLFPKKSNRIEPDDSHTIINMKSDDAYEFQQDFRVAEIKVNLIMTKSTPDMTSTVGGFYLL